MMRYPVDEIDRRIQNLFRVKWKGSRKRTWEPNMSLIHLDAYKKFRDKERMEYAEILLSIKTK